MSTIIGRKLEDGIRCDMVRDYLIRKRANLVKAVFLSIGIALELLVVANCFAQPASPLVYVEGTVTRADRSPLPGATISLSDGSAFTSNHLGHYFTVLPAGYTGSIRVGLSGYTLTPPSLSYNNISNDQLNQDFAGGRYSVSGHIFSLGANASLYFDGSGQGVTTASGEFNVAVPEGYSGNIIPLSAVYTYNPSSSPFPGSPNFHVTGSSGPLRLALSSTSAQICTATASTNVFLPSQQIYASIQVAAMVGDTFTFSWYDPAGRLQGTTSYTLPASLGPGLVGPCIVVASPVGTSEFAQSPGIWRMDFSGPSYFTYISQGSIPFAILATQPPKVPSYLGSMAHLASGDGWDSTIELVNTGAASAPASASFFGDDGAPLALPLVSSPSTVSTLNTLAPNSTLVIDSTSPGALQTGYAQLTTNAGVGGFIRFRYAPRDQEAIVPLETRNAGSYVLAFDNTGSIATGVAVANLTAAPANIPVLVRDNAGAQIGSASLSLPPNGHAAFVLTDRFTSTVNQTGTIEFDTPPAAALFNISCSLRRASPSG
jgi:hypothetical protein